MELSLFHFSSNDSAFTSGKYRLFLEGAKFAGRHGFTAARTPERHFHAFGGLYSNPSAPCSAIAMVTKRVRMISTLSRRMRATPNRRSFWCFL
jgi:alkanesulfonate monooxygenase SsuD/methylene tetrahydromethanopterin reductase-like flavin-dependent oxidoreductase (luciferase family)